MADGTMNLVGALRKALSTTGYTEIKEFQQVEIVSAETIRPRRAAAAPSSGPSD